MTGLVPLRRNRDFVLYQAGQLLSQFGSNFSRIAYPLLTLVVTGSAAKTGYVGAVEVAPFVLLAAAAGVASDRYDRRLLCIAADVVGAVVVAALGVAVLTGHASFWLILVVVALDSSASVFFGAAGAGAIKAIVPQPQLADASSVSMTRGSVIRLGAPPIGGAIFQLSRGLPFIADALSYAFSTVSLLLMRTPFQEKREPGARTPFREGLSYFWSIPFLRVTIGMIAASNIVAVGAPIALIILAHRENFSPVAIGAFIALQGSLLLAGSVLSPFIRRLLGMRVILLSEFWMGLVYVAFLVYPNVYVLAGVSALHAFWFPNTDSAIAAYSYALIPDRLLGRALAASNTLRAGSAPLGPLLAGLLLAHSSPRICVLVLALPVVVAAALGTASHALRDLPSLSAAQAEAG